MNYDEMVECVKIGLGHEPNEQEIRRELYGPPGVRMSVDEQIALLAYELDEPDKEWRLQVISLIRQIPAGSLITYGNLAKWARKEYGSETSPRNTAWLRKRIYQIIGHATDIPIHRVAKEGDTHSSLDEPVTQEFNRRKRMAEGSLYSPHWYVP